MNLLDLLLLLFLALAAAGGFRLGLLARASSWIGLGLGIFAATYTVPWALSIVPSSDAAARLLAGITVLVATALILAAIGESIGYRLRGAVTGTALQPFDHALGLLAGLAGALVLIWLLLPAAGEVPGVIARQARTSAVAAWVRDAAPEPPDTVRAMRWLIDESRFPDVFDELRPTPELGPPPSELPIDAGVVEQATAATANVEAEGCGVLYEGSAWVVGEELMVTNAHVVAGATSVEVLPAGGQRMAATVVAFDDDRDLALLVVDGLDRAPLELGTPERDTPAAVIGYPRGQDAPRTAPARVDRQTAAVGRDIYGEDRTERQILFLSAALQQGDSGSPVVGPNGQVLGVVFAISPDQPETSFALAPEEVRAVLDAPRRPGETGRCP